MPTEANSTLPAGGLTGFDHIVIGIYLLAMMGMGLMIARRQKSTDDFFVAGRNLPAWAVGISILASLLSTITFLGMPGEMFRTGIGFLTRQLGIPFVLVVVWFIWIPFFMRLNLTSAYEYLERRFNYATRALSAIFCLCLLFGWIAVVVLTASGAMAEIANLRIGWFFGHNSISSDKGAYEFARIEVNDVVDWTSFAGQIREQGVGDKQTPGKRIWEMFDSETQGRWPSSNGDEPLSESAKQQATTDLTGILSNPEFYQSLYWKEIPLSKASIEYVKAYDAFAKVEQSGTGEARRLSKRDISHLNRSLIVSAFPSQLTAQQHYRDADMHLIILSIGLFSIIYTTMGGIQAVIWTDVIQFFVLIGGAIFAMAFISSETGSGIGDWLEVARSYKHEEVQWFDWDVRNRSTVFSIALGMFFWFICTHGANQVALQRYFTVKNVWAARKSYIVSAVASFGLGIILAGVGLSMMYFIQTYEIPAETGIDSAISSIRNTSQDKIFPQFISFYLPSGLRGLVVSALFAAAMSTIDSGANSVSTIITVDFFRPFRKGKISPAAELRLARILTASMGVIVVVVTIFLYHLSKGTDLITLCQKGFNCFLGPLGAVFVLAMFSKFATSKSVIPALLVGEAVGIGSSYSEELFDVQFSTHLVVVSAWLATIVSCHVFALLLGERVSEEQRQWMWLPVVKTLELPAPEANDSKPGE